MLVIPLSWRGGEGQEGGLNVSNSPLLKKRRGAGVRFEC